MKNINYKKLLVIFIILCLSIIPCYALFTNPYFISTGHDNVFHFSQIQDLYNSFKNNPFNTLISPSLNHGVGVGTRLMYGSLSHYLVVLISFIVIPLGGNLMLSYKIVILLAYIFSNIVIYKLLYYITKNHSLSLIGVAIFALFPYRFTNVYIRNAFSETIVISILPLVFYGLIKWIKEDFSLSSYIISGAGIISIIHTHNISALFSILFILIFLIANYKKVYYNLKNNIKHRYAFTFTLLSIVIISLPFMITLLESMNGDYRVFNSSIMGTNYNALKDSYNSLLSYVIYIFQTNWKLYLITGLLCFSIPLIVAYLLNENKHRKLIFLIIYGCSALLCCILLKSLYVLFAFSISLSIMFFITNENNEKVNKDITKTFKILILSSLILLFVLPIWIIMPSLFKNIQFIWRMWGFICIFIAIIIPILLQRFLKIRKRYFSYVLSSSIGLLIMVSYPLSINDTYFDSNNTINENIAKDPNSTGWQLEYFPEIMFDNNYKDGSPLYIDIRNSISSKEEFNFEPYIYQGKASISEYDNNNIPNLKFNVECSEYSVIQLPLIYYKGYKITLTNEKGTTTLNNFQIDGLLSFDISESGTINIKYTGSTLYQISRYTQTITIVVLLSALCWYTYKHYNCKKNNKNVK